MLYPNYYRRSDPFALGLMTCRVPAGSVCQSLCRAGSAGGGTVLRHGPTVTSSGVKFGFVLPNNWGLPDPGPIIDRPDPIVRRIVDSWPTGTDAQRALDLGLPDEKPLNEVVDDFVRDYVTS